MHSVYLNTSGVWGSSDVKLLLDAVATALGGSATTADHVGKATAGACVASGSAKYWLNKTNNGQGV